jgi:hypothetical protein
MHKLTFLITLAAILFAVCSPATAQTGCIIGGGFLCPPGGGGTLPVPTFQFEASSSASTATQTWTGSIGAATPQRFIILGLGSSALATSLTSLAVAPNVGSTVNASQVVIDAGARAAIWQAVLLSDADTATTATITVTYSANPFSITILNLWTVASANLSSQTPVGSNSSDTSTSLTGTTTVATTSGGFVIAVSRNSVNPNATSSFSGTETYAQRSNASSSGNSVAAADASGVGTNASSSITATWGSSGTVALAVASWR